MIIFEAVCFLSSLFDEAVRRMMPAPLPFGAGSVSPVQPGVMSFCIILTVALWQGNRVCDICKTVVRNLPEPAPRSPEAESRTADEFGDAGEGIHIGGHGFTVEQVPGSADVIFDCIRVRFATVLNPSLDPANASCFAAPVTIRSLQEGIACCAWPLGSPSSVTRLLCTVDPTASSW